MANDPSQSDPMSSTDAAANMPFVPGSAPANTASSQRRNRLGKKSESSQSSSEAGTSRVDKPSSSGSDNRIAADEKLVDQTKQQIRQLVTEISELARTDCSVQDFYQGFLTRTTGALASEGGSTTTSI